MSSYLNVVEDVLIYFLFSDTEMYIIIIGMRAWMNDPIHVQV